MGHSERIPGFTPSFLVAFSVVNLLCLNLGLGDPPFHLCSNTTNVTADSPFQSSLQTLMGSVPSYASASKLYNTSTGDDPNRVYVQYMCLNYVTNESCSTCIRTASQDILQLCGQQDTEAVVWEEQCQLRYSSKNFLGQLNVSGNIPLDNPMDIAAADLEQFRRVVSQTVSNLTEKAAFDPSANMYAAGQVPFSEYTLYALAQCTTDLSPDDCSKCLKIAIANISSMYYSSRGARLLSRSCYLRYELYDFYEGATEPGKSQQTSKSNQNNIWKIIVVILASVLLTVGLVGFIVYFLLIKSDTPQETHGLGDQESAFMDLATIRVATGNFSDSNLLGEGGFGPVFKGVLSDGKEVAIKRLSNCSEQGSEEFTNEVLLIMKLQHKNLVRLLGFCVDGDERLVVYEFMSNNSLDAVLFDRRRRPQLNWSVRINIINGIAKGVLYLHEGSRLRIIHRDLKASNVLLDNDMNPKISDFGMARIFAGSEGEANTARIAGTYGYMAPEYAMEGLYSTRSDAFSFGVLVLEIITGRKNAGFHKTKRAPSLIAYAWQLWNEGKELELADPVLADSYSSEEFSNYVHVGLLCVQEDAHDRPAMSSVISMLNSQSGALPAPRRPAFSTSWFTGHNLANSNANNCSVNI